MIQVRAIGAAEVQVGRKRITKSTEMMLALAVYLCVRAGERVTRDEVVDMFWPGRDLAKGRHSLRQMLYRLRLKGFTLDNDGEELHLAPARVECDATRALSESWPESAEPWILEDSDAFLPGFIRDVSPQFQEWLDVTRSRLTAQYRRAALRQIAQARREGRWADLERWGRVVLRSDPLNEEATMARAESAAMAGSKVVALEILDQYVEDLGERAGQIGLPATVLRRRISERRPEWGVLGAEVRLVGREDLMPRLTSAVSSAVQGHGSALLLYGAPGIGKTRLANEMREFAVINGFRSRTARAGPNEAGRPLALVIALAVALRDLPGFAGTSPAALALIARLCEHSHSPHELGEFATHAINAGEIGWALTDALSAVTHECKLLIDLDDIHNADELSQDVLAALAHAATSMRVIILATSRLTPQVHRDHIAPSFVAFTSVAVPPLSFADACALVTSFAQSPHKSLSSSAAMEIARAGGGNPLFLRELTSQRLSQHTLGSTPQSLVEVIQQRTAHLSPLELRALRLVSLLGRLASFERLRALMPAGTESYDTLLEQLELEGVISMSDIGCLQLHECWHDAIRTGLKGTALSALALDCANILVEESPTDANLSNYWRAAELFSLAGSHERARAQFALVGTAFMKRGLPRQAVEAFTKATLSHSDGIDRTEMLALLAEAHNAAASHADAIHSAQTVLTSVAYSSPLSVSQRVMALSILVDSKLKLNIDHRDDLASLATAVRSKHIPDAVCQHACFIGMRSLLNAGAPSLAHLFADASNASASRAGPSVAATLVRLMLTAEMGSTRELAAVESELAQMIDEDDAPSHRALSYHAIALRFLGRPREASRVLQRTFEASKAWGAIHDAFLAATSLVFLSLDWGDHEGARKWLGDLEALFVPHRGHDVDHALAHARARFAMEIGDDAACISAYSDLLDPTLNRNMPRKRLVDQACLSLSFARLGDVASASSSVEDAKRLLHNLNPGINEDWVANTLVRSLVAMGAEDESAALRASYLERRKRLFDRPIPSGLRELQEHGSE